MGGVFSSKGVGQQQVTSEEAQITLFISTK